MSFERDYYALLGIPADANDQDIKRSYRSLARRYHPDVSQGTGVLERFREVQEAYELLTDPEQRRAYDRWREQQGLGQAPPLRMRVTPSLESLPCLGEPQLLYLLVEILAAEETRSKRLPLNLCLVLDRSTSMKGGRLQQVKEAARYIVDQLQPEDALSLIVFDDRADLVLPGEPGFDRKAARLAISQIESGGGTEILQGLKAGWAQLQRWQTPNNASHLILLTDGQTYGDEEGCLEMARLAAREHVSLTLMGVGTDWNDRLLDQMADLSASPGGSIYIDAPDKIVKAFHKRVQDLGNVCIQDLHLSLRTTGAAILRDAFRVSPCIGRLSFVDERVSLGPLQKERPQTFVLELLVAGTSPGKHRLMQIDVDGTVPGFDQRPARSSYTLTMPFDRQSRGASSVPTEITLALRKLAIFKMQERAIADAELGQIEPAASRLKVLATRLLDIGETELAHAALLEAGHLAETGSLSPAGRKKIRFGTRGLGIPSKEVRYD